MANVTFSINAIDKTRAVFATVDANVKRLSKSTASLQTQMMGAGLGVLGAGSIFVLLGNQVRDLIRNIDDIPGIPDNTRQSVRELRDSFLEMKTIIAGPLATGIAFVSDMMKSVGAFAGALSQADFKRLLNPFTAVGELAAASARATSALDDETSQYIRTLQEQSRAEREAADATRRAKEELDAKNLAMKEARDLANLTLSQMARQRTMTEQYMDGLAREGELIRKSVLTPNEERAEQMERLAFLYRQGVIDIETFDRKVEQLNQNIEATPELTKQASKTAQDLGWAFSSSFEDAIINGGKLRDVMKGLAQDIARILIRNMITTPLANAISGGLSGMFGGGKAIGGPVNAGTTYLVGERGPEFFTPSTAGRIIPNHDIAAASGSGGGDTFNFVYNIAAGVSHAELGPALEQNRRATIATWQSMRARSPRPYAFA